MTNGRIDAVFFDLDDTLIDRAAALRHACVIELERAGRPDAPQIVDRAAIAPGCDIARLAATLRAHEPRLGRGLQQRLRRGLTAHVASRPPVYELLRAILASGRELGVVTNGSVRTQRAKLATAGLDGLVHIAQISGACGRPKPHPHMFLEAVRRVGVVPSRALFVGDDPWLDIAPASRVGMRTFWISHGRTYPSGCAAPTAQGHDLVAVASVLRC